MMTAEMIEERLAEAADTLARLPEQRIGRYVCSWPNIPVEPSAFDPETRTSRPPPSSAAISRMDVTLDWLRLVPEGERRILWMRAERQTWKAICHRFGISRATADRRYRYALSLIAWRLEGRRVPTKRGRGYVVAQVQKRTCTDDVRMI